MANVNIIQDFNLVYAFTRDVNMNTFFRVYTAVAVIQFYNGGGAEG